MKYLIISTCGLGLFLVPRLGKVKEVEKIYFYHVDTHYKSVGLGLQNLSGWEKLELISDYSKALSETSKEDLVVVIDDVGAGETGDRLRKLGYKVIGGSKFGDKIEDDRQYATDLMSRVMNIPETTTFDSFDAGIQFVKSQEKTDRFVFKPNDADVPKEYTYVAKDVPDLVTAMQDFKAEWKWKESFQIQKVIKGIEVDFNAYFNGLEFIDNSMLLYFENKAFMDNDIGPATGGSIAVAFARKPEGIFWEILNKLVPLLKKVGYRGQLAVNCIVSEEDHKPYFLEFCGRFGYPSLPVEITLIEDNGKSIHDLFMAMINGINNNKLFPTNKIGVTVSVFVPPAPTAGPEMMIGTKSQPISWSSKWDTYFFPYYVMYDKKKGMVLAGLNPWVLQVTCADVTLEGAVSMTYDTYFPTLKLKNSMYRSDLGKSAKERIKKLREWEVI